MEVFVRCPWSCPIFCSSHSFAFTSRLVLAYSTIIEEDEAFWMNDGYDLDEHKVDERLLVRVDK